MMSAVHQGLGTRIKQGVGASRRGHRGAYGRVVFLVPPQVSASGTDENCTSSWGRRFDPTTDVNPVLEEIDLNNDPCTRATSFVSKVKDTQAGQQPYHSRLTKLTLCQPLFAEEAMCPAWKEASLARAVIGGA